MKKLKFILASILVLVMSFAFVACANDPLVGEWKAVSAIIDNEEMTIEEFSNYHEADDFSATTIINADGTCHIEEIYIHEDRDNFEYISDGRYEVDDEIVTFYLDENLNEDGTYSWTSVCEYKDGKLYLRLYSWPGDDIDSKVIYGYLIYEKQ